ncbi:hypothetical protein Q9189_002721 [Teloschistes chrysophthalmus]
MSSRSTPSSVMKRRPASHAHHPQLANTSDQDSDTRSSTPGSFYTSEDYTNSTVLHVESSNGGMIDVRPGRSLSSSSLENGHLRNKQTCRASQEQQNAGADQCWRSDNSFTALATRPSSSRQYKHLRYHCQSPLASSTGAALPSYKDLPDDSSLPAVASSVLSEPTTPQDRLRNSGRGKSQSMEKIRQPRQASLIRSPSTKEHLTSSSEYNSLGSTGSRRRQASPNGNLKTLEQGVTEPSMVDAATQTASMDHNWEETTSQRSENAPGARHNRQGVFHRVSRPIRLERKLRRPTMRKVQVIVSLDGATDLAMNARLVPKRPQE